MTRVRLASFLLIFAVFAAACGGSDATDDATAASPDTSDTSDRADTAETVDEPESPESEENGASGDNSTPPLESDSPIENLLGVPVFDDAAMTSLFADLSREAEVAIATCMVAQGFEYTPDVIGTEGSAGELATDTLQYAEQRGLGIVVDFNEAEYDPATARSNENAEYVADLSDGERDAYFIALTGMTENDEGDQNGPIRGCAGQAQEEVFSLLGVFDIIETDLNRYYDLFISDSRVIALTMQWQECMADAGFLFDSQDDLLDHIIVQVEEILNDEANFAEFDSEAFASAGGFFGNGFRPPLVPEAQAAVDAIGEEEVRIAVANWTCREPIKDLELEVQREYESQFVDEVGPEVRAAQGEG